uniref:Uncharacterized protein LOC111122419 isoform X1 n=1 Tax=Crassostrea virginica TaxID=6565 RepID=A0A8B8CVV4_CRAVI|nr:uncharacterized protein LOC111122419 isoform X1 [Crassostrea virginica]XP_022319928.1 uncharacterized protein LOC111122419 isoform X1 [Crassostrea virginica]XP_022319937.1 uncharacterized protein LOC111122419 isoform X1 [Crassostrea virginica]
MFKLRKTPCPVNKTVWEEDKSRYQCTSFINFYHCIQDERNRSGEICIQPIWVLKDYCPEYNSGVNALDIVPCNVSYGCPDVSFLSNQVYQYPACLNKIHIGDRDSANRGHSLLWLLIGISVLVVILLSAIICCFFWRRKQHCSQNDPENRLLLSCIDSNGPFFKTTAYHQAAQFIKDDGRFLFLIGQWGSGKTTVAKRVYTSVTGKTPLLSKDLLEFDINEREKSFIFDEAISRNLSYEEKQALKTNINSWCERKSSVPEENLFIIFTLTDANEYKELIKLLPPDEKRIIINLHDSLTKGDRSQILYAHFQYFCPFQDFSKIEQIALRNSTKSLGFPERCLLYSRSKQLRESTGPVIFFNRPLRHLKLYLQTMNHSTDRDKFLLLVYMCLNEMKKDIEVSNKEILTFLESHEPYQHGEIEHEDNTNQLKLIPTKNAVNRMEKAFETHLVTGDMSDKFVGSLFPWEFVDRVPGTSNKYRIQHDVIKRMTLIVYGTCHFAKLLEYAKPEDLEGWIEKKDKLSVKLPSVREIRPVLKVSDEEWKTYGLKCKLSTGKL